jgi:predicted transglutaminase-like cysteine proteinase
MENEDLPRRRHFAWLLAAVLTAGLCTAWGERAAAQSLADVAAARQGPGTGLFGSTELRSESLEGLPQWTRVLQVMEREGPAFAACAADAIACPTPVLKNWRKVITSARKLPRGRQIDFVNKFFNQWPYKQDVELYGLSEYWAAPREFMSRSGDCEDYSIAKYFALRALGFDKEELRIVILMDEIRNIGHAVLTIQEGGDILVLDSLSNLLLSHTKYKHYRPQYSMNETTRWAHIGGFGKEKKPAYQGLAARP